MERSLAEVEQTLHRKVDAHEFTELSELVRKKVDVTVFLQAKTEISDNAHKVERDLRGKSLPAPSLPLLVLLLISFRSLPKSSHTTLYHKLTTFPDKKADLL